MSRVRRIRAKKTIPKPKPIKIGSRVNTHKTNMKDARLFQDAVNRIKNMRANKGKLKAESKEEIGVDFQLTKTLGFRKSEDGRLEIVTVAPLSKEDQNLIRTLDSRYQLEVAKDALEKRGFSVEEATEGESTTILATKTEDDVRRSIEVSVEQSSSEAIDEVGGGALIRIHAREFENEQQCKEAAAIVSEAIEGRWLRTWRPENMARQIDGKRKSMLSARSLILRLESSGKAKATNIDPELLGFLSLGSGARQRPRAKQSLHKRKICCRALDRDLARVTEGYRSCRLCEVRCGIDRFGPHRGICGNGAAGHIYASQVSCTEESAISPTLEIFFTGCNLRCCNCHQSEDWPFRPHSLYLTCETVVADIMRRQHTLTSLSFLGGNPEQSLAAVLKIILALESFGARLPYVFNSNFLFAEEYADIVGRYFDVFVPDFKFWNDACSVSLGAVPDMLQS